MTPNSTLYDKDYFLWLEITIQQLRAGEYDSVDWANLFEELESLGKQQQQELENRLIQLFEHILKLAYWASQQAYNARNWQGFILRATQAT